MVCPSVWMRRGSRGFGRLTKGLSGCRLKSPRVPNGDREDSLGLSTAMPQVTSRTHQGTLKGRERT